MGGLRNSLETDKEKSLAVRRENQSNSKMTSSLYSRFAYVWSAWD